MRKNWTRVIRTEEEGVEAADLEDAVDEEGAHDADDGEGAPAHQAAALFLVPHRRHRQRRLVRHSQGVDRGGTLASSGDRLTATAPGRRSEGELGSAVGPARGARGAEVARLPFSGVRRAACGPVGQQLPTGPPCSGFLVFVSDEFCWPLDLLLRPSCAHD